MAYLSMEFGLAEALPLYSGGLGILAGDTLKTASDLGIPMVGVGLLYQQGYFRQALDAQGRQRELFPYNDPVQLPVFPVRNGDGEWVRVSIPLPGRRVRLQLWEAVVGRARLLLLDSNDPLNTPADRGTTAELYGGSTQTRLQQEIVLGIGGVRALDALGIQPDVFHLNEGHTAFATVERAHVFARKTQCSFETALTATRAGNLFTTHTPVEAGFDRFSPAMIRESLSEYCAELEIDVPALLAMGRKDTGDDREPLNMAVLALRGSGAVNAVSRLHGEVSRRMFQPLFPGWPFSEVPVGSVTNGIHAPSWDSAEADTFWTRACGKERWRGGLEALEETIKGLPDAAFWQLRMKSRKTLIAFVRQRLASQLAASGAPESRVSASHDVLDPNVLTVCFAHRFVEYKRPNLLLQDPERLVRLLMNSEHPVQIVLAGKAHPSDGVGKELIHSWTRFIASRGAEGRVVFLNDYDMLLAERLVQGADVWINTPRRPWEASGTSGMKVLVNGGLNVSSLDGWWAEAFRPELGWSIGDGREHGVERDAADATELYEKLESDVVPMFYRRDERQIPMEWVQKMRASIAELTPHFSTNRMLREYLETYYVPLAGRYRARAHDGAELAKRVEKWRKSLRAHWTGVRVREAQIERAEDGLRYRAQAEVMVDELEPDAVKVELFAEGRGDGASEHIELARAHALAGSVKTFVYEALFSSSRPAEDYTLRVVAQHPDASIPLESNAILWHEWEKKR